MIDMNILSLHKTSILKSWTYQSAHQEIRLRKQFVRKIRSFYSVKQCLRNVIFVLHYIKIIWKLSREKADRTLYRDLVLRPRNI